MSSILIVDDHESHRLMLRLALSADPHTILEAADGEEALVKVDQNHVDLMVLDVVMPVLDGFQVLERLKARPAMPVVVVTANHAGDPHVERLLELGAIDVIGKPFDPARLVHMIDAMLKVDEDERQQYRMHRLAEARGEI